MNKLKFCPLLPSFFSFYSTRARELTRAHSLRRFSHIMLDCFERTNACNHSSVLKDRKKRNSNLSSPAWLSLADRALGSERKQTATEASYKEIRIWERCYCVSVLRLLYAACWFSFSYSLPIYADVCAMCVCLCGFFFFLKYIYYSTRVAVFVCPSTYMWTCFGVHFFSRSRVFIVTAKKRKNYAALLVRWTKE